MEYRRRKDIIDLSGKKFGNLLVIEIVPKSFIRGAQWKCKCDCGNECLAYGGHLRNGSRVSCGCKQDSELIKSGLNRLFLSYKGMAKKRGWEFSISREKLEELVLANCTYCGREPLCELKRQKTKKLQIRYNGIDRFDSTKGYTEENCKTCCYYCNHSKLDLTFEEWMSHLKRIFLHQGFLNG